MKRMLTTSLLLTLGLSTLAQPAGARTAARSAFSSAPGAVSAAGPAPEAPAPRAHDLDSVFSTYELVGIDAQSVTKQSGALRRLSLRLGGQTRELELEPNDLRAQGYRATLTTDQGVVDEAPAPVTTYKGSVVGEKGSDVRLQIDETTIFGYVRTADDRIFLESASKYEPGLGPEWVVAYREADVRPERIGDCGATEVARHAEAIEDASEHAASKAGTARIDGLRILEIATEADFEFHQATGGTSNATILGVLNQVDGIYVAEIGITVRVVFQNAFTTSDDPYSSSDSGELLRHFQLLWKVGRQSVHRDVAHLFTGRDLDGKTIGRAFVGTVCDEDDGYGISQNSPAFMAKLVSHEVGHNLGLKHDPKSVCPGSGPLMCPSIQLQGPLQFSDRSKNALSRMLGIFGFGECLSVTHDDAEIYTTDGAGGIAELNGFEDFRESWDIVVPGDFGGGPASDLLLYDRAAGHGEFLTSDGTGGLARLRLYTDFDRTWDIIVPGDFGGDGRTDLLFYDADSGLGAFFATDGAGGLILLGQHGDWDRGWDLIVPGQFGGDGRTDLLFFDRDAGLGSFWATDGRGGIIGLRDHPGWDRTWDTIVAGDFGGGGYSDLFFYDGETGLGEFYATDGSGGMGLLGAHGNLDLGWDVIVPGQFGGDGWTDLLFYDREGRLGSFNVTDGGGGLAAIRDHGGWRENWHTIVPGHFNGDFSDGWTDLFFYER